MDSQPEDSLGSVAPDATYVNYLQAGSTAREIMLEFGQYHSGDKSPRIHVRLVTHPGYVEEFLLVMTEALRQHEAAARADSPCPDRVQ
jgi:hypothetical protein